MYIILHAIILNNSIQQSRYQYLHMYLYYKKLMKGYISRAAEETSIFISLAIIAVFRKGFSSFHLQRVRRKSSSYGMLVYRSDHWPRGGVWFPSVSPMPMPCKLDLHAAAFGSLPNWLHLIPIDVPRALWYFIRWQRRSRAGWCATKFDRSILRRKVSTASTNDGPATKNRAGWHKPTS